MNNKLKYIVILFFAFALQQSTAQDKKNYETSVEKLEKLKTEITSQEKEALKIEIEAINKRLEKKQISESEAQTLKESAAKKRALNIENRLSIVDNQIALIERNQGKVLELDTINKVSKIEIGFGHKDDHDDKIFGIKLSDSKKNYELKYDVRTYSDMVIAVGFNNAVIDG
mgnify:FL=1